MIYLMCVGRTRTRGFRLAVAVALVAMFTVSPGVVEFARGQTFQDVTASVGLDVYSPTSTDVSVAWADHNGDGWVDLYLGTLDAGAAGLFENNSGSSFTAMPGAAASMANHPGLFADYNNDGHPDIISSQAGGHLVRNNGGGSFTGIGGVFDTFNWHSECAAWGDFDNDTYLDSYRAGWEDPSFNPYPDGRFMSDVATHFDLVWTGPTGDERNGRGVTIADFDEDGDVDVYVSNYRLRENFLWLNDGAGDFTDVASTYGVAADGNPCSGYPGAHSIASAWGDLDNDGHLDLVVGNFAHSTLCQDRPRFYRNMGSGGSWHFEDKSGSVGLPYVESHASPALADYDNDGDLDVFITAVSGAYYSGQKSTLIRNDGNWAFTDVSVTEGLDLATANTNFQAAWCDYDNDGDLDLYTGRKLYENTTSNGNHWLKVKLVGDALHFNRDAVGAQVRIDLGGGVILTRQIENATGWGNQNDPTLHFGLGTETGPVNLEIFWPDGTTKVVEGVAVDQFVEVYFGPVLPTPGFELPDAANGIDLRQGVHDMSGAVWQFSALCGVADDPNVYLGGLTPDGYQAGILFDNGAVGNAGQIWQDLAGGWEHNRTYTVSWSEGAAYVNNPGNITRYADLSVYLYEILETGGLNPAGEYLLGRTQEIWTASMVERSARFVADLKPDDPDPVIGYRLMFDARGLEGTAVVGDFGYVVVDSVFIDAGWFLGDMDCDDDVDNFDIDAFVLALTDPAQYALDYPDCDVMNADCDNDGDVDNFDIDPFVALLIG